MRRRSIICKHLLNSKVPGKHDGNGGFIGSWTTFGSGSARITCWLL